jgi:hypothetical protein
MLTVLTQMPAFISVNGSERLRRRPRPSERGDDGAGETTVTAAALALKNVS